MKKAMSVTLGAENVLWLRGQAAATSRGSVSEVLDRLVGEARTAGRVDRATIRSVVGTVDLPDDDLLLDSADSYIRTLFAASARRPQMVKETAPRSSRRKPRKPARG